MKKVKSITIKYLRDHYFSFILQAIVLYYIGNLNFSLETKESISIQGSIFGFILIILSLIINALKKSYIHG